MNTPDRLDFAWDTPESDLVALRGGPRDLRWYTYPDWLAARLSSRRMRCDLARPDGACRCYAPTTTWIGRTDKPDSEATTAMRARVWHYIPPTQWAHWGREYLTPDERTDHTGHTSVTEVAA
ncbi:hypothetical protein ALI144C_02860 [Actinosynnema sp. ALI-1.44]|uniref:hypothetical protein n=1 Tax=Actinosynnema sp. ALI-1.44 TaxID=1933779 RepID=UPI00097CBD91|nr:hypothetical protein [Actinosynnema sp. ALI-1.44]ONI90629.1 hypothetical protein ALI144C_02860 [Actinosynnema sp. ALI-1.44]